MDIATFNLGIFETIMNEVLYFCLSSFYVV